jgi:hypothetical protein
MSGVIQPLPHISSWCPQELLDYFTPVTSAFLVNTSFAPNYPQPLFCVRVTVQLYAVTEPGIWITDTSYLHDDDVDDDNDDFKCWIGKKCGLKCS